MDIPQNLSEKNQSLQSENRRLRERLLELYVQIDSLSAIAEDKGIFEQTDSTEEKQNLLSNTGNLFSKNPNYIQQRSKPEFEFNQTENIILPGGAIYSATVNPKSTFIAVGSLSGTITILTHNLKTSSTLNGHSFACRDVIWGSPGLISCGFDKTIRIWDVETNTNQCFETNGLAHSVTVLEGDENSIFAAAGTHIYWIDKRRQTPITISSECKTTAVSSFQDYILFGGYDGYVNIVDRRHLHGGIISHVSLEGGPISSISKVLPSGQCIGISMNNSPMLIQLNESKTSTKPLPFDPPERFGCRGDIIGKNIIFENDYSTMCGGKMSAFSDGSNTPTLLKDINGFKYGAIFMGNIAQKIITYSEDGVVSMWSAHQS